MVEVLSAALQTSRGTLHRLMALQSQIEAEISTEEKQAERLEFLLEKARADYAYFATLDKMFQQNDQGRS